MTELLLELFWWAMARPLLFVERLVQGRRSLGFWRMAYATEIQCGNCGQRISLVGFWRCGCHFTYRGHLLRECPICGSMPRMVRCFACGVTRSEEHTSELQSPMYL